MVPLSISRQCPAQRTNQLHARDHAAAEDRHGVGLVGERAPKRTSQRADGRKHAMKKTRLEAFSDGVIAIIITIMVLEMKV